MATAKRAKATTTGGPTLTVKASPDAKFIKIVAELQKAFKEAGCPTCRSGKERIVFQDIVAGNIQ